MINITQLTKPSHLLIQHPPNSKNPYKISKAVKYRFNIDCINNTILVKKLKENEYAIFTKIEK